ncbi:mitochondrial carrier domain-containing protein [Paraphysoderma sedebokerense]|nr:mitochondrial carrier domain-containing protein [Paraphysoderma sedebokerense]
MDSVMLGTLSNLRMLLQSRHPETKLSIPEHGLAGIGAGMTVSMVACPIELIKAKLQVQYDPSTTVYRGPIHCAQSLIRNNGIFGLWQGLSSTMLFRSFFWVLWGSYEWYTQTFTRWGLHSDIIPFFAGGCAANTFWAVSFPADVIKNRIMAQPDVQPKLMPSISAAAKLIYQKEGIKGFYRGFIPCQLRSFPTNGAALMVFEFFMNIDRYM